MSNAIIFVTILLVTSFLNASIRRRFYLFFIRLDVFFVGILYCFAKMRSSDEVIMNKLDTKLQKPSFAVAPASHADPLAAPRFIVLIPADSDYRDSAHRIWEVAHAAGASVHFLGLCRDVADEPGLRRGLTTLAALVHDGRITTEVKIEIGTNWVQAVRNHYQHGDVFVCFSEPRTGLWQRPLPQILKSNFDAPLYILTNSTAPETAPNNWLTQAAAWSGSLGILVVSFVVQVRIGSLSKDWIQTFLLCVSVLVEVGLIWGWNSLCS